MAHHHPCRGKLMWCQRRARGVTLCLHQAQERPRGEQRLRLGVLVQVQGQGQRHQIWVRRVLRARQVHRPQTFSTTALFLRPKKTRQGRSLRRTTTANGRGSQCLKGQRVTLSRLTATATAATPPLRPLHRLKQGNPGRRHCRRRRRLARSRVTPHRHSHRDHRPPTAWGTPAPQWVAHGRGTWLPEDLPRHPLPQRPIQ